RVDGERAAQHGFRARHVAFLDPHAADVDPSVRVPRLHLRDFQEDGFGVADVALQQQPDAVVVPALARGLVRQQLIGRDGRVPRPPCEGSPLWRSVRPLLSTASSSIQTSNASTVPPGKKCPIFLVRTTTSTRTDSPRRTTARTRSRGATTSAAAVVNDCTAPK